jgi:hypothetical protein
MLASAPPRRVALLLFVLLLSIYHADGGFVATNGVKPNVYLSSNLLDTPF